MTAVLLLAGLVAGSAVLGLVWRARQGSVRRIGIATAGPAASAPTIDGTVRSGHAAEEARTAGEARMARRFRKASTADIAPDRVAADLASPGADVTLLQLSTPVCAPCAATRRVLEGVASERPGVAHVELDVADRTDVASRFHVLSTPTTLVLDRDGRVRARIAGAARHATVLAEIDRLTGAAA